MNPILPDWLARRSPAALAKLVFGGKTTDNRDPRCSRHLSLLPITALELDLGDAEQRHFGDYELLEQLGAGGTGVVYRARQESLDREVAIKLLSAGPWASSEFVERFRREAQSAARLNHPNIVPIFEVGCQDELHYFSMPLVPGPSLADRIAASGPMDPRDAARLARTLAEALDYAHRLGVLHLDLKPANVLVNAEGDPLIADFGLARRIEASLANTCVEISGTPSYMAPEQIEPAPDRLGTATDVHGLGAILCEVLCGTPPYSADSVQRTLQLVLDGRLQGPKQRRPDVPADLDAICMKCLAREPGDRYRSARELADDLGRFLEGRPVCARPLNALQRVDRWMRREPRLAASVGVAALALMGGTIATSLQWKRAEIAARQAQEQLWQRRSDEAAEAIRTLDLLDALPPLVANLAEQEAAGAHAQSDLSRTRIGALLGQAPALIDVVTTGAPVVAAALDPAGKWLATAGGEEGTVRLFDLGTGNQRWSLDTRGTTRFLRNIVVIALESSDDGRFLVGSGNSLPHRPNPTGIDEILIDLDSGSLRMPPAARYPGFVHATFSPDGAYALVRTRAPQGPDGALESQLLRTVDWQPVGPKRRAGDLTCLMARRLASIACTDTSWQAVRLLDPGTWSVRHTYRHADAATVRAWSYSHDGRILALGYEDGLTVLLDTRTGGTRPLPRLGGEVRTLRFSEDDAWLAGASPEGELLVWDLESGRAVAPPFRMPAGQSRLHLDHAKRSLFAANAKHARLWRLPDELGDPAVAVLDRPRNSALANASATAISPRLGLMAVGTNDGSVRLWRYREPAPLPGLAAPLRENFPGNTTGDGHHAVTVADDMATVLDVRSRLPAGPGIRFPQALSFAGLTADGKHLVASAGPRLYVHDPYTGKARYASLGLEATPQSLLLSPRSDRVVVIHTDHVGGKNVQVLESYDLATGLRSGRHVLDCSDAASAFSADGRQLQVWHFNLVDVLDPATLEPRRPTLRQGADLHGQWLAFYTGKFDPESRPADAMMAYYVLGADGSDDVLWTAIVEPAGGHRLQAFDGRRILRSWSLPSLPLPMTALGGEHAAVMLAEQDGRQVRIHSLSGDTTSLPVDDANHFAGLALSGNGERLAVGLNRGVQVFDARTGDWLTPPIRVLPVSDRTSALTIDAAGQQLLVRGRSRRIWPLRLQREARPVIELQALTALMRPERAETSPVRLGERTRSALRSGDPGPPSTTAALSQGRQVLAEPRLAVTQLPNHIDLTPSCNVDLSASGHEIWNGLTLSRLLPPGRHRLLGVDYDVRCAIIASHAPASGSSARKRIDGIRVAPSHAKALNLLMMASTMLRDRPTDPYAVIELGYRDGTRARLPVLYRTQLWEWLHPFGESAGTRIAYVGMGAVDASPLLRTPRAYAVRLENPYPQRELTSLALETIDREWSRPILLAVTLEPATSGSTTLRPTSGAKRH